MSALPKAIYKLDVTAVKISKGTFNRTGQADSQANLEGKKKYKADYTRIKHTRKIYSILREEQSYEQRVETVMGRPTESADLSW